MYRDKIEHKYLVVHMLAIIMYTLSQWESTLQGRCAIFNDIHGRIKPTDILIMCSAHK